MTLKTISIAMVFAIATAAAVAPAQARHHHIMTKRSGPGLEPGAPDASRPGGKGVNNKPGS